jgi:putative ABC transport system permease protein
LISRYVFARLRQSKLRTAVSLCAIFFTIMVTLVIGVLFGSGQQSFVGVFTQNADYDLQITAVGNESVARPYFNVSDVDPQVRSFPVEAAYPMIATLVASNHTHDNNFTLMPFFGVDEAYDRGVVRSLTGTYHVNDTSVVLSDAAARKLNATVNDTVPLYYFVGAFDLSQLDQTNFVGFILNHTQDISSANFTVAGIIDVGGRFPQGASLYIVHGYNDTAARTNATGKATHYVTLLPDSYYDIADTNDPAHRATLLGTQVADAIGPGFRVEAVKAQALRNAVDSARGTALIANMFAIVFPAITGILVAGTLNLSVEEKARDLAVMRLIGARRRDVGRVLLLEAGILLAIGVPLGLALGLVLPGVIVHNFFSASQPVAVSLGTVVTQLAISLGVTGFFLVFPLRRALATTPAQAVYQVRSQGEYKFIERKGVDIRLILGGAVLFAAILYATFAVPYILVFAQDDFFQFFLASTLVLIASLAVALLWVAPPVEEAAVRLMKPFTPKYNTLTVASIRRNIRRNASTNLIFALIVGIMLFFTSFFSGIISSVDVNAQYSVGSDVRLTAFDGFTPAFVEAVASSANVSEVALLPTPTGAFAQNLVSTRGSSVTLMGLDTNLTHVLFKGERDAVEGDLSVLGTLDNRSLAISAIAAQNMEVHRGDIIALEKGSHRDFFTVALILRSLPGFLGEFQDQQTFGASPGVFVGMGRYLEFAERNASTVRYADIFVKAKPGADTPQMARDFQDLYGVFVDFFPLSKDDVVAQARQFVEFITWVSEVILIFLILVAVFSLTVNLYASVQERSYEIGVVRSLGLRRSGVLGAVLLEGLSISFVSAGIGVVVGVLISFFVIFFFNIFSPIDIGYQLPGNVLFLLLIATGVFATIGSLGPARSVARKPIISLMRKIE